MVVLNNFEKSQLRRKYEKLNPARQGGLPSANSALQALETEEILSIFEENDHDWQKWPTLTELEDHLRNLATLRQFGQHRF
jgi:hypothetical protein